MAREWLVRWLVAGEHTRPKEGGKKPEAEPLSPRRKWRAITIAVLNVTWSAAGKARNASSTSSVVSPAVLAPRMTGRTTARPRSATTDSAQVSTTVLRMMPEL